MLGVRDLKSVALPVAWDGNELSRLRLRSGETWESVVRDIEDGLNLVNSGLMDGYIGKLIELTTEESVEYRSGGTNGFEDETEQVQPDRQFADTTGHMLPLKGLDRGMGWTEKMLKNVRRRQIDADIATLVEDAIDIFEKRVWQRFFTVTEYSGKAYGLGATGVSVPFADGGAGTIPFIPTPKPSRKINAFTAAHNHFLVLNGINPTNLETAVGHLWEHGYDGPYELIVSLDDLDEWQNTTTFPKFKEKIQALIDYGGLSDVALVDTEMYQGAIVTKYGTCKLYANARIQTGYWAVTRSFGSNDPRNPLKVRYDEATGFGVKLIVNNVTRYPFQGAIGQMEFGAGVGEDRVAAVIVEDSSDGTFTNPTIA